MTNGQFADDNSGDNSARLYAILLIIIGFVLAVTVKSVSGDLDFSFETSGDVKRWKNLFFQPLGGISGIIMGVIILIKKRTLGVTAIRVIGIIWFLILALASAITNDFLTLLISLLTIFVVVKITKRSS